MMSLFGLLAHKFSLIRKFLSVYFCLYGKVHKYGNYKIEP